MGASPFSTTGWGRTPSEAFVVAKDRALYDHGHAGYSGTLAEKHSFTLVELPPRQKVSKFVGLVERALFEMKAGEYAEQEVKRLEDLMPFTASAMKNSLRRQIAAAKKEVPRKKRAQAKFARECGALLPAVMSAAPVFDDKWGPAVAVEVKGAEVATYSRYASAKPKRGYKLFVFVGLASS